MKQLVIAGVPALLCSCASTQKLSAQQCKEKVALWQARAAAAWAQAEADGGGARRKWQGPG